MAPSNQPITVSYAAATARQNVEHAVCEAQGTGTVTAVSILPDAAVTGAASPRSRKYQLVNVGSDGSGTTVIAELRLAERVNLRKGDEADFTMASRAAEKEVRAGDVLVFKSLADTEAEGLADTGGGTVQVTLSVPATEASPNTSFVTTGANEKAAGYFGKRGKLRHPDTAYALTTGPESPSGANGPE